VGCGVSSISIPYLIIFAQIELFHALVDYIRSFTLASLSSSSARLGQVQKNRHVHIFHGCTHRQRGILHASTVVFLKIFLKSLGFTAFA
jgi:hypothetical protein